MQTAGEAVAVCSKEEARCPGVPTGWLLAIRPVHGRGATSALRSTVSGTVLLAQRVLRGDLGIYAVKCPYGVQDFDST